MERNSENKMTGRNPKVFISYSWENKENKEWARELADKLLENGIDAYIDQYDLSLGDRLPQFMEQQISDSDYVLIICTPEYKKKAIIVQVVLGMKVILSQQNCFLEKMNVNLSQ